MIIKGKSILHITNDYSGSTVYKNLVSKLDNLGIEQIVYNPIRRTTLTGKNKIELKIENSEIIYSQILSKYSDRIFYRKKINKILKDIESKLHLNQFYIVHAHTWYSDGGVAFELFKKYNVPYIVTIRNTDLNLFFKYMLHLRKYGLDILLNASKIIFISPIYMKRFFNNKVIQTYFDDFNYKCEVIPNGVDDFWVDNVQKRKIKLSNPIELLYVGSFTSNKNVISLLKAVEILNYNVTRFNLKIVGSGGKEHDKVLKRIQTKDYFSYLGEVKENNKLKEIFNNSDIFTMPSKSETFGLVYIEAISQGIPILFTKNEGVDGIYENIGECINPLNIKDISCGINKIMNNYYNYQFIPKDIIRNHNWSIIAEKYYTLYSKIHQLRLDEDMLKIISEDNF